MITPREVYGKYGKPKDWWIQGAANLGYRIVAFRAPRSGDRYLNAYTLSHVEIEDATLDWDPSLDFHQRWIVEKI